ncbi:hypothetical protein FRC12_023880 [Ceratobasidium sp. 428]|nr:hypothetical protein FRC12_023880 [Ceratobasidium sp. 428]
MAFSTAYLTPPYLGSECIYRGPVTPPTVRPRSSGDTSRWHPYTSRFRSSTPTAGLRPSRSSESVSSVSSRHVWPQPANNQYLYPGYESVSCSGPQYTPPSNRRPAATAFYVTPDPSPNSVRYSHKHSYSVPPTIDYNCHYSHPALLPTPPRSRNASVEFEGAAPIPFCSIDAPHASSIFVQHAYDLLMSIYYHSSPPPSPISSPHAPNLAVYMPIPGSLPIDPPTLHWFTAELIRRASVSIGVLKLAMSYISRARSAARRACEARIQTPISPPPSPPFPVPPQLDGGNMYTKRPRSPVAGLGPELADPRQMLLGALVLAQKFLVDAAYTSATWGRLSGLPTADVAAVERALGSALDWRLWEKNL